MMNNLISMIITATVVTSCATYSVVTTNPIEETMIIIQGEYDELIELRIDAGEYSITNVDADDIYKEKQQSSNQLNNNWRRMRVIKLPVESGTIPLKIYRNGKLIFEKDIYIGKGQIRKIQI
tara:strand:+ start:819 stop:1184 length:366 start_codon:yes stop_codon:yes gene_type:complete